MATNKKLPVSLESLGEEEKKKITAELIARGLSPKQMKSAVGITNHQIEEWLTDDAFKEMVENIIQSRLIKVEQAKNRADEILLKGADTLSVLMASIINLTNQIGMAVSKNAKSEDYVYNSNDADTVFKMLGLFREMSKELNGLQIRNFHIQSGGNGDSTNPLDENWSPNESIKILKIIERTREIAIKENVPIDRAREILLKQIEVDED